MDDDDDGVTVGSEELVSRSGNESEKKDREPLGNVEMTWRRRGVFVDGHVELQMFVQRFS